MSMTHEEAARILDPETIAKALREYGDGNAQIAACDEACRIAADVLRGKHTGEALTMEQLREMGGNPVWIVEYPDWGHWELSEDGEDYIADRYPELYGLRHDDPEGRYGLHKLGWLAYAYPPANIDREAVDLGKDMIDINNLAVSYIENGPYENDLPGMEFAIKVDQISKAWAELEKRLRW